MEIDFDSGFNNWMGAAIEYESRMSKGKEITPDLEQRMEEARNWFNNLSDDEYSRLIH